MTIAPARACSIGRTRVRQHVNPLRAQYQQPTGPLDFSSMFEDPSRPLVVDLGAGPGRFLLLLHQRHARHLAGERRSAELGAVAEAPLNFLGVEIRQPVRGAACAGEGGWVEGGGSAHVVGAARA